MSQFDVIISDDLDKKLNQIVYNDATTMSEVFRKSLQLYIAAREATQKGMTLNLVDPNDENNKTEIIGL